MKQEFPFSGPIGVFDSGYGGLTVLRKIRERLPQYDYLYLGDNARAPYGPRSFDVVYRFTLEAVKYLFSQGCPLVILACNTASAKALRSIQQNDLPEIDPTRRVLGVIRPTVEELGRLSNSGVVGVLGTNGTIRSRSYDMEIAKLYPGFTTVSQECPLFVPLVENNEFDGPGADYFVNKYVDLLFSKDPRVDTVILGCTHYPLLYDKIRACVPSHVKVVSQGEIVAESLADYLQRHPEIENRCRKGGVSAFLTTENPEQFTKLAGIFLGEPVNVNHIEI
ncbi:MAG: glutamate racemase [Firmicutes bacterium]|nr:glutamate racemase [Bacillota bacterium]MCM1401903.1 glutamate racemase [Bacteroides sp.]MCM1477783.1 glutamate racemase [Bacteroides sp.]